MKHILVIKEGDTRGRFFKEITEEEFDQLVKDGHLPQEGCQVFHLEAGEDKDNSKRAEALGKLL